MFTGIIEAVKPIKAIYQKTGHLHIEIEKPADFSDVKIGSSIACNGICLTAIDVSNKSFTVEIMNETIKKSTAGKWQNGELLNLERALLAGGRLDGHWVQGHIDTVTALLETKTLQNTLYLTFSLSETDTHLIVPQGSIAINGVSLTISDIQTNRFSVALIGHTISYTNLSKLNLGSKVNIEFDIVGKYLQNNMNKKKLDLDSLNEMDF